MDILEKARKILLEPVCDSCLGRQFAQLLSGYTNEERGKIIRTLAAMSIDKEKFDTKDFDMSNFITYKFHNLEIKVSPKKNTCAICSGLFSNLEKWRAKVVSKSRKYELSSFLIGTKLSFELIVQSKIIINHYKSLLRYKLNIRSIFVSINLLLYVHQHIMNYSLF